MFSKHSVLSINLLDVTWRLNCGYLIDTMPYVFWRAQPLLEMSHIMLWFSLKVKCMLQINILTKSLLRPTTKLKCAITSWPIMLTVLIGLKYSSYIVNHRSFHWSAAQSSIIGPVEAGSDWHSQIWHPFSSVFSTRMQSMRHGEQDSIGTQTGRVGQCGLRHFSRFIRQTEPNIQDVAAQVEGQSQ